VHQTDSGNSGANMIVHQCWNGALSSMPRIVEDNARHRWGRVIAISFSSGPDWRGLCAGAGGLLCVEHGMIWS